MNPSRTAPPRAGEASDVNLRETLSHLEDLLEEFHAMLPAREPAGESAREPSESLTEEEFRLAFGDREFTGELDETVPGHEMEESGFVSGGAVSASEFGMLLDEELLKNLVFSQTPEPESPVSMSGDSGDLNPPPGGQTGPGDSAASTEIEAPAFLLEPPILSGTARLVQGPELRGPRRWLITACEALIAGAANR